MNTHHDLIENTYFLNIPLLDGGFDDFDWNDDLDALLHETENATLYHAPLRLQE